MTFRKPQLVPLLFILLSTLTTAGLGLWQLERLAWKNALIANIEKAQIQPVLTELTSEPYRRVAFFGTFTFDRTLHLVGKPQKVEGNGYFQLTPFTLDGDKTVLVNRGWAPSAWKEKGEMRQAVVHGVIRPPRTKRLFSPSNHPEKNIWFYEDIVAMAAHTGLALENAIIEAVDERKSGVYPYPSDGKINLRNDHLGYAITWFSLAFIGLFMFAAYHRKPKDSL